MLGINPLATGSGRLRGLEESSQGAVLKGAMAVVLYQLAWK